MTESVVAKFGGTSMAQPEAVAGVLDMYPEQQVVVVSAPGKDEQTDYKMTDRLIDYTRLVSRHEDKAATELRGEIISRFDDVYANMLSKSQLARLRRQARERLDPDNSKTSEFYEASGEYLSALYLSRAVGITAVQPAIRYSVKGLSYTNTDWHIRRQLEEAKGRRILVPGYYGSEHGSNRVHLLGRGGSDRTQMLYGRFLNMDCYNWTDKNGIFTADPDIVKGARRIPEITRREVREGAHGGNPVLQGDTVVDAADTDVTIWVRDTFHPKGRGTKVVRNRSIDPDRPVVGISARPLTEIMVDDLGMANRRGYLEGFLRAATRHGVSIEHVPTGQDGVSLTTHEKASRESLRKVAEYARKHAVSKDAIISVKDMGVVYVVGEALRLPLVRTRTLGKIGVSLADRGLAFEDVVSHRTSPALALLVENKMIEPVQQALHEEFLAA